jgi:hypothetical protein
MSVHIAGLELIFVVAAQVGFDYRNKRLWPKDDTAFEIGDRLFYADSKDNNWIIFPEEMEWEATFSIDDFQWHEVMTTFSVALKNITLIGDPRVFEHDVMLTKLIMGETIPDQSLLEQRA